MTKKKRNMAMLLAATSMIGAVLTGCSSAGTTEGPTVNNKEVITVDFWSAPNQGQYNYWEQRAKEFNAEKKEIDGTIVQVKVQQMPETPSSEAGIQNAIATGTVPAISENINRGFAATLANSGVVYELQDEAWFQDVIENRSMEDAIQGWAIDGKQYVLPVYVNPMTWQCNAPALKALGFNAPPATVAEFDAVLTKFVELKGTAMKELGVTHTFYRPSLTRPDQWWDRWHDFQMPYQAFTGGKNIVEGNKLVVDKEGAIEAFELLGKFGNTLQMGELVNIWSEDQPSILATINAPWDIEMLREADKVYGMDGDYVYGPSIVKNEGDTPYNYADAKGLVLYKHESITEAEHEGAEMFVEWIYNDENSSNTDLEWLKTTTMLPVRGDLTENETFKEFLGEYPELQALAEIVPYSMPSMPHDKMTQIQEALTEKGIAPYINEVLKAEPLNAPDATPYVEAALEAMKAAGELE